MITTAPLPEVKILIRALNRFNIQDQDLAKPWTRKGDIAFWFSRSAWAMKAIVLWWEMYHKTIAPLVWLPDYFCNESLWPLRHSSAKLVFYPIDSNLMPDWDKCHELAQLSRPDIFFQVHYFGYPSEARQARLFCNENNSILVEDSAHVLLPIRGIGEFGDFVFYSPHKLLSIPDGAVLLLRTTSNFFSKSNLDKSLQIMQKVIEQLGDTSPSPWWWLTKRLIQKLPFYNWFRLRPNKVEFLEDSVSSAYIAKSKMSKFSRRILLQIASQLPEIIQKRQENDAITKLLLGQKYGLEPLKMPTEKATPYLTVFQLSDARTSAEMFRKIIKNGHNVTSWPDIAPEVMSKPAEHEKAIYKRQTTLTFPIHQSIKPIHLIKEYSISSNEKPVCAEQYNIIWDECNQSKWENSLMAVGKSNLLQSWAYGEAKAEVEGWKVHRGMIQKSGSNIAMCQALVKSLPFVEIIRINRGPLWLRNPEASEEISMVLKLIIGQHRWNKKKVLLIAPELNDQAGNLVSLFNARYHKYGKECWCSAWLDLQKTEGELRRGLNGKWRNMVSFAERAGLVFKISHTDEDFFGLMDKYQQQMLERNFKGISINLLIALRKQGDSRQLLVMQAIYNETPVAGLIIAKHGLACTYLVGWNSTEGRQQKANNFLLWNSLLEMKSRGCLWFDLGGIDEVNTPDIARFKRGLNGQEYRLVGEYFCI